MRLFFATLACLSLIGISTPALGRGQPPSGHRRVSKKAYLGVALAKLSPVDRRQKKVPQYGGVLIQSVLKRTPAHRAGFLPGDVIMRIGRKYVYKPADVIRKIAARRIGTRVKIDIIRNGQWMMAKVLLTARPARIPGQPVVRRPFGPGRSPTSRQPPVRVRHVLLKRLKALEREVRLLRKVILELKSICKRR